MKFVSLLHKSELQVTELTEYRIERNLIQSMQKCDKNILSVSPSLILFTIIALKY